MVSVATARASIQAGQQLVARQKQQIQQRTTQPTLTPAQLRQQTQSSIAQRQVEAKRLGGVRKQALETLDPISKSLSQASRQVSSVESQLKEQINRERAFKKALDVFSSGDPRGLFGLSKLERNFFRQISAGKTTAIRLGIEKQIKELEKQGLSPIFVNGELKGISDLLTKQSRELGELKPIVVGGSLVGFSDIAQQIERQLKIPIPIEVVKPFGVVLTGETNIQQLVRNIKESQPQFAFVEDKDLREALQKATPKSISQLSGLEKFSTSKFKQVLSDPRGKFKFTPEQSERIGDLTSEIVVNVVTGLAVGKALTLFRGAGAKFLPKGLKDSTKFKKLTNTLGITGGIVLGGAAGLSLKKTFEEQGIDKAIQEAIGIIAFGVGFAKTGLKTTAQAEKQIDDALKLVKKAIPESKRGQVAVLRKKKKKATGRFAALEELEADALAERQANLRGLERKIAEQKTAELQLQILRRIQRTLKTKEQKEGFKKFVQELLDKNILKFAKIREGVGITARFVEKPAFELPKPKAPFSLPKLRNQRRVQRNLAKNKERIEQSKKTLGQKFKESQKPKVKVAQTSQERIKEEQKERQKLILRQRQIQKEIQQQGFKLILRERAVSKNKLRELLRSSLKTTLKIKKPLLKVKIKLKPVIPFIPLPKLKVKKKKLLAEPFKPSGRGYNVFVKSKGKFLRANINPITKQKALDIGAFVTDRTLSQQYKIVKTNKNAKNPKIKVPRSYFGVTRNKWRGKIVKGKEQPIKDKIFERRKAAIDTLGEKRKLRAARLIADLKKKAQKRIKPFKFKRIK